MHTEESLNPNNSWQNQGIMRNWAKQNIPKLYREVFLDIVDESFGYGRKKTMHKDMKYWSNKFEISRRKFQMHTDWLEKNNFITKNTWHGYIPGGGSEPNSYSPCYPKGYAMIKLKDKNSSSTGSVKDMYNNAPQELKLKIDRYSNNKWKNKDDIKIETIMNSWLNEIDTAGKTGYDIYLLYTNPTEFENKFPEMKNHKDMQKYHNIQETKEKSVDSFL